MRFWKEFFQRISLIPGCIIPAGYSWHSFLLNSDETECNLPFGKIYYDSKSNEGIQYIPSSDGEITSDKPVENLQKVGFNTDVLGRFRNVKPSALLELEPILSFNEESNFNLNLDIYVAENALKLEKQIWRWMRIISLTFSGIVSMLLFLFIIMHLFSIALNKQRNEHRKISNKIENLRKENAYIQSGIERYKELLNQRSSVSEVLSRLGKALPDSLWLSEVQLINKGNYNVVIIGHSLTESGISRFLGISEKIEGIKSIKLEYTEKISSFQVAKLTHWKRKMPLYRFKIGISINL